MHHMVKPRDLLAQAGPGMAITSAQLGARATESLRALIQSGDLPPGTHLIEGDLADLLHVSRGPIREALRNLVRENLVLLSPNRGAMVAEWEWRDILDLFAVRRPLEVEATALATERAATDCACELAALFPHWRIAAEAGDHKRCADFDLAFHQIIWQHADNRFLSGALQQVAYPLQTIFYLNLAHLDDYLDVMEAHAEIRRGILTHDATRARAAMAAHMEFSLARDPRYREPPRRA